MTEDDNYYIFESNNKYSKSKFSKEEVIELNNSLKNCFDCINCFNCTNCIDCIHCYGCNNCTGCTDSYRRQGERDRKIIIKEGVFMLIKTKLKEIFEFLVILVFLAF